MCSQPNYGAVVSTYLWQVQDEVVGVGLLGCHDDVVHGDSRATVADVLGDGGGEEDGLLLHDADERAQPLDVEASDVMTIQGHLEQKKKTKYVDKKLFYFFTNCESTCVYIPLKKQAFGLHR